MATNPNANVTISADASALAGGTGYCVVIAPVAKNADAVPRVYSSYAGILAQHDYSQGADYSAHHIRDAKKPVIFVGIPIATPGTIGRQNSTGVTGTSAITVAAGPLGVLDEVDASVVVTQGGTIGTDDIRLSVSADGGLSNVSVRLGTKNKYTFAYLGIVVNFGAGTLVTGDRYTFTTTAPKADAAGIAAARAGLQAQQKLARSWMSIGDVANAIEAGAVVTAVNAYESEKKRFTLARVSVRDRLPLATKAKVTKAVTGSPSLTFAASGFTITRATGSFVADGFSVGDMVTISGSASNNGTKGPITALTATVMTFASGIANEGPTTAPSLVGSDGLVFTATTITRSAGSWLSDGFRVGDSFAVAGTASNNGTKGPITALTATVLTVASGLAAETVGSAGVTITKGETMAGWVSAMDSAFASIDSQKRISLGLGRLWKTSPITGWNLRRSIHWPASVREYQHDVHRPTWTKEDRPLDGWHLTDANDVVVEYDESADGGALAARFTCAKTWPNDVGAFIAMDLTRADEGTPLAMVHNMNVANVFCTVVQKSTEDLIGKTPVVNRDGTATSAELTKLEEGVNSEVKQALLREFVPGEGPRASRAVWQADPASVLRGVNATLNGAGELDVNGTIVNVNTLLKVN